MKNRFRYLIFTTLVLSILLITASSVHAQPPPIGQTTQPHPFESNPTDTLNFMVGAPTLAGKGAMMDGDLASSGDFYLGGTHTIRPNGDGTYTAWTGDYYRWKEETPDDAGSYVSTSTASARESSTLDDPPADASGTIASVKVFARARRSGTTASSFTPFLRLGSTDLSGTSITLTSTWTTYSQTIGRPGGGDWTWDDITNLEAGVLRDTGTPWVTQLYVEIAGPTTGFFELNTFTAPETTFTIGFVDIKMYYKIPSNLTDDSYKIEYSIDGSTWATLQPTLTAPTDWTMFGKDGAEAVRPWSQVARPGGGSWTWDDIGTLRIRITVTQNGGSWDGIKMYIFEAWASVYPLPLPPSGGTPSAHLAVIPSAISEIGASDYIFVDIYVTGVSQMGGFYLLLTFNNETLTPDSVFIYHPFTLAAVAPELNDAKGWVILQQGLPDYEPGFMGSEPIARIYFSVDQADGYTSSLNIINSTEFAERTWPEGISESKLKDIYAVSISHQVHDGWYGAVVIPEFPLGIELLMAVTLLIPIIYLWRRKGWKK